MTPEPADPGPLDRRRVVVVGVVASVLIAAAGATAWAYGGDVPRGTRVLGVDLGGLSRTEAERKLREAVGPRTGDPVRVELGDRVLTVPPADVGLSLNVELSVGKAIRGRPSLFGERNVAPSVQVDDARLDTVLRAGSGLAFDPAVAAAEVRRAWLTADTAHVPAR
ncbi:hypothetical protein Asp14428_56290 [Actinoplanes sp. NBRC 14428]|uniref:Peptidoglycan binding domain-containing protein n=1 Tax=Pseudosporangium ferrugineum TaxID=439699 RepID=A0A2T0S454_9ACTN|nr:hypothetical protein [Pseudosporangium ferrugineum]PRY28221.1 hypothetical protein CLV70_10813 [Pseudosporangium ferrugineum]BCJ54154.1 hypothetical protein Asp14428_56290 [Actinoplanes sp. NBRC 14428]